MVLRSLLTTAERGQVLEIPTGAGVLAAHYTLSEADMSLIRQRRADANRLGFAIQLCLLRHPGIALADDTEVPPEMIDWVAARLAIPAEAWDEYGTRGETRQEHGREIRAYLGMSAFGIKDFRQIVEHVDEVAAQTDKGLVLVEGARDFLRSRKVASPGVGVIERACAQALTRANRRIYAILCDQLSQEHRGRLDGLLLRRTDSSLTEIGWLRQAPLRPNARSMNEHIDRLTTWRALDLPWDAGKLVHRNRLLKLAREGASMTAADLAKFEPGRRYATLFAMSVESMATVTDEIIDLHDRIIGRIIRTARNKQNQNTLASRATVAAMMRLHSKLGDTLIAAKENGEDPFAAIETAIGWESLAESIAQAKDLTRPALEDHLALVSAHFTTLRRYTPAFLAVLDLQAAPAAQDLVAAITVIRTMNTTGARKIPEDAPTSFIRARWKPLVFTENGTDRGFYEFCALAELKNALRSGDMWVTGSRQFRDFDDYLLAGSDYTAMKNAGDLPLVTANGGEEYLKNRLALLSERLHQVNALASRDELPGVLITASGVKITPLETIVPPHAQPLIDQASAMFPRIRITDLLMEVDGWTGFTRHFTNLKSGQPSKDKQLLLTAILADGINLGLTKMSESCTGVTYAQLDRQQASHIRDETYSAALAELVNTQHAHPFGAHWGDGTTSSSDGQRFRAGSHAESTGHVNPKYGSEPGRMIYTHVSDKYSPFHSKLINVGDRDATYVLDGLLYHESDLAIQEHYTDTAGFTDHLFALMHLLGYRFAPRIRNIGDTRLYTPTNDPGLSTLTPLIGGTINTKTITAHWDEILRLATSIKTGTVTASLMMRKLGAYPRQNGLATALRELGKLERTLFLLDWLQDPDLRRKVTAGLNKGEARNTLARAVFFNRLGEIRDRSFEQQRYRASGLNLLTAAIVLWNTVYLDRTITTLNQEGNATDPDLLRFLSPLGWEHINLTGDYTWPRNNQIKRGKYRPLRRSTKP
ncbi:MULTISPECIES: Tn3 family transposase [Arthrobacter]|uniref:Tn3 family transposase n=1 Tax=Arthrobacter psychrochitiniphilus TaxID=291045 RepID=A0A2V3DP86_9MICC|nr:Tn3 family transposase [Arthrobacter psychrochitiniphilus]NYG17031.1 TnpA family transposase [Arthrobacter psychrochitiniphilus]PXA64755.1 Tn3 family transposase [Arthrobacter psychrochitiniphilus]